MSNMKAVTPQIFL